MSPSTDYYESLGVSRGATSDEIRKAYRRLARTWHPDVNKAPEAAERFAAITEAYEVLGDAEKRKTYDQFGRAGVRTAADGFNQGPWGGGPGVDPSDVGSIFEELFGARGGGASPFGSAPATRAAPPRKGRDLEHTLQVTFMTAALGGEERLRMTRPDGSPQTFTVKIPAGIEPSSKLRLKGRGQPGPGGGPAGDLLLTIDVGRHPWYRREGLNLVLDVPISLAEAALGTTVDVPLLDGSVTMKVPPGASSGQVLRIKGRGIAPEKGDLGDFLAVVQIVAPKTLSASARELMEKLAPELQNPRESGPWAQP